jgi:hypothetical protein
MGARCLIDSVADVKATALANKQTLNMFIKSLRLWFNINTFPFAKNGFILLL